MKEMTALVRLENGNLKIVRDEFENQKSFAADLRANGFKVLKIWSKKVSNEEVGSWEFMNRK